MFNKDILHLLWKETNQPTQNVTLNDIGNFSKKYKNKLNYDSKKYNEVSASGLDYAVLTFIWHYCDPIDWNINEFAFAKKSQGSQYNIWKKYPDYKVNVLNKKIR